jgi:YD repeat-containing protein
VLSEDFDYAADPRGKVAGSGIWIYDPQGYELEEFRYEADGSLHSHVKLTRKTWQVFKIETTSVVPGENETVIHSFDSDGVVTQTEIHDRNGAVSRTTNELLPKVGNVTGGYRSRQESPDGEVTVLETTNSADPATGLSRNTTTVDGKTTSSVLIQRDASGARKLSAQASPDGSFSQIERKPDGKSVRHTYWAPAKTYNYTTMDQENRPIETIQESPSDYHKTTFHYDGFGRRTEMANYDRSGKLVSKDTTEYRNDNYGNWIEQKESQWEAASGTKPAQSTLVSVHTRTITYY